MFIGMFVCGRDLVCGRVLSLGSVCVFGCVCVWSCACVCFGFMCVYVRVRGVPRPRELV